jgi:8-oxo-dGTP pyrophosphatase MutT (NUDIX family)
MSSGILSLAQKCVIYNKDTRKILILKRSDYKLESAGLWDFPGGMYEIGEDSKDSLKRECIEEINFKLNNIFPIDYCTVFKKENIVRTFILSFCDDYELVTGCVELSSEHTEFLWIDLDKLENYIFMSGIESLKSKIVPFINRFY